MISKDLLKELKQILLEDYQVELSDAEVLEVGMSLKGIFGVLISAATSNESNLIINENKNEDRHVRSST